MKDAKEVVACVIDYGYFISLADKLSETFDTVYYYSPFEHEYLNLNDCVVGDGLDRVERMDEFFAPEIFDTIDLFIFPDIGFAPLQQHLRSLGKAVWGSFETTELEMVRTKFLEVMKELGLPLAKHTIAEGITELADHLRKVDDKWIKIDRYRGVMETWHHRDWQHSERELERLALTLGAAKEYVTFVIQDPIPTDIELGYDGWCVDGEFPFSSFQGYENKNELYIGALKKYSDIPKEIQMVNEAFDPILTKAGYRNFLATEVRIKDKEPYFIDPTFRMPGQTGEQLLETCSNLADVVWHGANGQVLEPKFKYKFSVSATLHYDALPADQWRVLNVPEKVRQWVKLMYYCQINDVFHIIPSLKDEVGVVLGVGNTIQETFAHLKKNLDILSVEPISCQLDGFFDLLDSIRAAEKRGMKFSDQRTPTDQEILKLM
jgi:hypothetical protein